MFRNIKNRILNRLRFELQKHNVIDVTTDSKFGSKVTISGAMISGNVNLGEGCKITHGVQISGDSRISIGRYSSITGPNTDINSKFNPVTIGAFTSIARNVSIQEFNHRIDMPTTYHIHYNLFDKDLFKDDYSKGPVEIGNDVWIGTHSVVLTGSKIGDGVVIGANSVVTDEIPAYAIAVGSPAKVIGYRFDPEIVKAFTEIKWWEWSLERIRSNKTFFAATPKLGDFTKLK